MSLLRRAIIAGRATPAPAPACAVTLESPGVAGSAFDASAIDIDGQTLSKTLEVSSSESFAGGSEGTFTLNWTGRRALEFGNNASSGFGTNEHLLVRSDFGLAASWQWRGESNEWAIVYEGFTQQIVAGADTDTVAFVVSGNGAVEFWKNDALIRTTNIFAINDELYFVRILNLLGITAPEGATSTTTVHAAKATRSGSYDGADDWCGN